MSYVVTGATGHLGRLTVESLLDRGVDPAEIVATGRTVETVLLSGEVVGQLVEHAELEGCDLIAVGGHRQGIVDRILIGSVRSGVLRAAKCSVLIGPQQTA